MLRNFDHRGTEIAQRTGEIMSGRPVVSRLLLLSIAALLMMLPWHVGAQLQRERQVQTGTSSTAAPSAASRAIAPNAPTTLAELQARVEEIVRQPALEPGFFAVKI